MSKIQTILSYIHSEYEDQSLCLETQKLLAQCKNFWVIKNRDAEIPISRDRKMLVFCNKIGAERHISVSTDLGTQLSVCEVSKTELAEAINIASGKISGLCVYWIPPISIIFPDIPSFVNTVLSVAKSAEPEIESDFTSEIAMVQHLLTERDEATRAEINRDYKKIIANAHFLVSYFVKKYSLDLDALGKKIDVDASKLRQFCEDFGVSDLFTRAEFRALLEYFRVGEYLYYFRKDCDEVNIWVNNHSTLDKYPVTFPAENKIREVFTIKSVTRGKTAEDNAYIYQLELSAKTRDLSIFVSDATGCIPGRKCEVHNLAEVIDDEPNGSEFNRATNLTDEVIARAKADFSPKSGTGTGRRQRTKKKHLAQGVNPDEEV